MLLERHRGDVERVADPTLRALFDAWLGHPRYWNLRLEEALDLSSGARAVAEDHSDARVGAYSVSVEVWALVGMGRVDQALGLAHRATAFIRQACEEIPPQVVVRAGLAMAASVAGRWCESEERHAELLAYADDEGSTRAAAAAHAGLALLSTLRLDPGSAIDHAERAITVTDDPVYAMLARMWKASALSQARAYRDAVTVVAELEQVPRDQWVEYLQSVNSALRAGLALTEGNLSTGIRAYLHEIEKNAAASNHAIALFLRCTLGEMYVRTAAREDPPRIGALLRNPRFVLTHGLQASRLALETLTAVRTEARERGCLGFVPMASDSLCRLHITRGTEADADAEANVVAAALAPGP